MAEGNKDKAKNKRGETRLAHDLQWLSRPIHVRVSSD